MWSLLQLLLMKILSQTMWKYIHTVIIYAHKQIKNKIWSFRCLKSAPSVVSHLHLLYSVALRYEMQSKAFPVSTVIWSMLPTQLTKWYIVIDNVDNLVRHNFNGTQRESVSQIENDLFILNCGIYFTNIFRLLG